MKNEWNKFERIELMDDGRGPTQISTLQRPNIFYEKQQKFGEEGNYKINPIENVIWWTKKYG